MIAIYDEQTWPKGKAKLLARSQAATEGALNSVRRVIDAVRQSGDEAVLRYTLEFDGVALDKNSLRVTAREIEQAYKQVDERLLEALRASLSNIRAFHEKQRREGFVDVQAGRLVGQLVRPIGSVGVYVPGGRASYPSSVLMNVVPAKAAGVKTVCMATPPQKDGSIAPLTLVAAAEAGVDVIYRMGGAQAIAALAYGTQSVMRVDKITGPGNMYVALAKREVFGQCGIDMIAGPSEVCVIADAAANPDYVAADMLSQAEHDPMAAAWMVTDSETLAEAVAKALESQLDALPKADIARAAIESQGAVIVTSSLLKAIEIANDIAPEHLELMTAEPMALLGLVQNAGAVFLGAYSPEPLGDYYAGPNHVLPTGSSARFSSALGVEDFIKRTSVIQYSGMALQNAAQDIMAFAKAEGLDAHAKAVEIRLNK